MEEVMTALLKTRQGAEAAGISTTTMEPGSIWPKLCYNVVQAVCPPETETIHRPNPLHRMMTISPTPPSTPELMNLTESDDALSLNWNEEQEQHLQKIESHGLSSSTRTTAALQTPQQTAEAPSTYDSTTVTTTMLSLSQTQREPTLPNREDEFVNTLRQPIEELQRLLRRLSRLGTLPASYYIAHIKVSQQSYQLILKQTNT